MNAIQKCRKCGAKYTEVNIPGEEVNRITLLGATNYLRNGLCVKCGGDVIWVDDNGIPLNEEERMKFIQKKGILAALILGAFVLVIVLGYRGALTLPIAIGILAAAFLLNWASSLIK